MHEVQAKLLKLITPNGIGKITLSELGEMIGIEHRQKVKYHLDRLEKENLIEIVKKDGRIVSIKPKGNNGNKLVSIPIYGSANCGPATLLAEENFEGYLKISRELLETRNIEPLFALKASGQSMNKAKTVGGPIKDGDYVIVDSSYTETENKEYVVSVIDGCANIKRLIKDEENNRIILQSESEKDFPPIFIHENDDFLINGKVIQVLKNKR